MRRRNLARPSWLSWSRAPASGARVAEDVLSEHLDALYRASLRLCAGREADAEDLIQDVALRVHSRFSELRDVSAAKSWLFTILTRTHLNRVRAQKRRPEVSAEDMTDAEFEQALEAWRSPDLPDRILDRARTGAAVEAALDALDHDLRSVVWLVDVEGFRQREAAVMLSVPPGTIASRLFRGRAKLRDELRGAAMSQRRQS